MISDERLLAIWQKEATSQRASSWPYDGPILRASLRAIETEVRTEAMKETKAFVDQAIHETADACFEEFRTQLRQIFEKAILALDALNPKAPK